MTSDLIAIAHHSLVGIAKQAQYPEIQKYLLDDLTEDWPVTLDRPTLGRVGAYLQETNCVDWARSDQDSGKIRIRVSAFGYEQGRRLLEQQEPLQRIRLKADRWAGVGVFLTLAIAIIAVISQCQNTQG